LATDLIPFAGEIDFDEMGADKNLFRYGPWLDWRYPNAVLVRQFTRWIEAHRPKDVQTIPAPTGAASGIRQAKKTLKQLGAHRILQHCGGERTKAIAFISVAKQNFFGSDYSFPSFWTETKNEIGAVLRAEPRFIGPSLLR